MSLVHGGALNDAMQFSEKLGFASGKKEDWLDLSTGINPCAYPLPEFTLEDWQKLPEPDDLARLVKEADRYFGLDDEKNLLPISGSALAIQLLAFFLKGWKTYLLNPTYGDYGRAWPEHGHFEKLDEVALGNLVVITNPNNPDGRRFSCAELSDFAIKNSQRGGFLIVDEAFGDLYPQDSIIHLTKTQNVIVLKSFGKFFGYGGLRLGFIAAPDNMIKKLAPLLASWPISGPAIKFGIKAYADDDWHSHTRILLHQKTERITALFKETGLEIKGQTSLFTLIENDKAENLFHNLLKHKIYIRYFLEYPGLLRFGLPKTLDDFERLKKALYA